jgi:hypothetical protein
MADSAAETGLSNAASGSDHAGVATDVDAVGPNDAASSVREGEPKTVDVPMRRKRKVRRGVAVPQLPEATRTSDDAAQEARFRVFVIDTGWNEAAHKVLRKQIPMFDTLVGDTPTYWLNRKTSVALLGQHRELIGHDPIVCVHDLRAVKRRGTLGVHGLRLHLGQPSRRSCPGHAATGTNKASFVAARNGYPRLAFHHYAPSVCQHGAARGARSDDGRHRARILDPGGYDGSYGATAAS